MDHKDSIFSNNSNLDIKIEPSSDEFRENSLDSLAHTDPVPSSGTTPSGGTSSDAIKTESGDEHEQRHDPRILTGKPAEQRKALAEFRYICNQQGIKLILYNWWIIEIGDKEWTKKRRLGHMELEFGVRKPKTAKGLKARITTMGNGGIWNTPGDALLDAEKEVYKVMVDMILEGGQLGQLLPPEDVTQDRRFNYICVGTGNPEGTGFTWV